MLKRLQRKWCLDCGVPAVVCDVCGACPRCHELTMNFVKVINDETVEIPTPQLLAQIEANP